MNSLTAAGLLCLGLAGAGRVDAQDAPATTVPGPVLGASYVTAGGSATGWKLFGGGWWTPNFGFQVQGVYFTESSPFLGGTIKTERDAVGGFLVGSMPLGSSVSVFGKSGFSSVKFRTSETSSLANVSGSGSDWAVHVSIGLTADLSRHWSIRAEAEGEFNLTGYLSFGVLYRF